MPINAKSNGSSSLINIYRVYANNTDIESVISNGQLVWIRPFYIQTTNGGQAAYRQSGVLGQWTEWSTNTTERFKTMFVRVHIPSNINLTSTSIATFMPLTGEQYYMRYITNPAVPDLNSGSMDGLMQFDWNGNYAGGGYVEFAWEMNHNNPCQVNLYINNIKVQTFAP